MSKDKSIKIFFALLGTIYLVFVIVGAIAIVGTSNEPTTYTWWSVVSTFMFIISCHISIEWIKDLFRDE